MPWTSTRFFVLIRGLLLQYVIDSWVAVALSGPLKSTQQFTQRRAKWSRLSQYHFIHVGKTGGTSMLKALEQCVNTSIVQGVLGGSVAHGHHAGSDYLYDTYSHHGGLQPPPEGEDLIIAVRSPIHRFVSGFLSRKRQGRPAYQVPWTPEEKMIYEAFPTPDDLACALSAEGSRGEFARSSVSYMKHVFQDLEYVFAGMGTVKQLVAHHNILLVARTEHLVEDYARLISLLQQKGALARSCASELPRLHSTPTQEEPMRRLGRCAVLNLQKLYENDYNIIDYLAQYGLVEESYGKEIRDLDAAPAEGESRAY